MELIKIHFNPARPATIADIPELWEFCAWLKDKNGTFEGFYPSAYSMHHAHVSEHPINAFCVIPELIGDVPGNAQNRDKNNGSFYFPTELIINPEIVEATDEMEFPISKTKKIEKEDGTFEVQVIPEIKKADNTYRVSEACMFFKHKAMKKVKRHFRIKVRYQTIANDKFEEREEWIEGFKAQIFQHEVGHAEGKNIYRATA